MKSLKFAIDLLWVRHNQVGGIETVIRNLLCGLMLLDEEFDCWLLVSVDNAKTFSDYTKDPRFHIEICDVKSSNVARRIIWQNFHLGKIIRSLGLDKCFEPYYCKPLCGTKHILFLTIIHDLQAFHYPQYFSLQKNLWMRISWKNAVKTSFYIMAISAYVKSDILNHYNIDENKVRIVYDPVDINKKDIAGLSYIESKYGVKKGEFFFTVSSLLPHKNIKTLLKVINDIKSNHLDLPTKLIVSGIGGKDKGTLQNYIISNGLEDNIRLTSFIEDAERNALYKYCRAFLFPSVFEGFGMPPVEAMLFDTPVITTRETSLEEVTQGLVTYVDDPYSSIEWIKGIQDCTNDYNGFNYLMYEKKNIAKKVLELLDSMHI